MACFFHSTNNMDSNLKLKLNPLAEQGASLANAKVLAAKRTGSYTAAK